VADQRDGRELESLHFFRTARNSTQDAVSNAVAIGKPGVTIATLAPGLCVRARRGRSLPGCASGDRRKLAFEEYAPTDTQDFTASAQRIFDGAQERERQEVSVHHLGGRRQSVRQDQRRSIPERFGIEIASGGNIWRRSKPTSSLPGMEGATYYYYEIPKNPVNDLAGGGAQEALQRAAGLLHRRRHGVWHSDRHRAKRRSRARPRT